MDKVKTQNIQNIHNIQLHKDIINQIIVKDRFKSWWNLKKDWHYN